MRVPKIDPVKLDRMLTRGKSPKQCAEHFGVSASAISQAKKALGINVVKNVALENAHRVVDKNLNAVDQLQKINDAANEILDALMSWTRGDTEALQVLDSWAKDKKIKVGDKEHTVKEFRLKDPRELALKAMAEIRSQLKLQLDIFQCLYDLKAVQEFQEEVISAIGDASPDVRDQIIHRLNERRAVRSAIQFD